MTQQKAAKRRVRARMAKTGERYTAARAQLLRSSPTATAPVPDSPFRGRYGASDESLVNRTGHDWGHWYRVLDAWGAKDRPHPEIARFLSRDLGVDGWWSQELTVRYEMAIGRREPNQRTDGFEASGAKTMKAPPERVYAAIVDDGERAAWIDRAMRLRRANQNRTTSAFATIRFDWEEGASRVVLWLADKGDRTTVSVAHQRLPDHQAADDLKGFWRERLAALAAHVEGRG